MMQLVAAAAMEPPSAPHAAALKDAMVNVFRAIPPADPDQYVRGQYEGYRDVDGVAPDQPQRPVVASGTVPSAQTSCCSGVVTPGVVALND